LIIIKVTTLVVQKLWPYQQALWGLATEFQIRGDDTVLKKDMHVALIY
jgi:hypothetical protein